MDFKSYYIVFHDPLWIVLLSTVLFFPVRQLIWVLYVRKKQKAQQTVSEEEKKTAITAVKVLGLSVAGVDMIQSERGTLVIEVNSSPGLEGIETTSEIDVASEIIKYMGLSFSLVSGFTSLYFHSFDSSSFGRISTRVC